MIMAACWCWISQAFPWYCSNLYSSCYSSCTKTTSTWLWNAKQFLNKTWWGNGSRGGKLKVNQLVCRPIDSTLLHYGGLCYDSHRHFFCRLTFCLQLVQHKFYERCYWSVGWYATSCDARRSFGMYILYSSLMHLINENSLTLLSFICLGCKGRSYSWSCWPVSL